jgi:hypothetical protein
MTEAQAGSVLVMLHQALPIGSNELTIMKQREKRGPVRSEDHMDLELQRAVIVAAVQSESTTQARQEAQC